jgi:MFS family permease
VPAIAFGWSQAILFPAIVAAGAVSFPTENRGLATVLVLATWDIGVFIGSPAIGLILHYSTHFNLPPYPAMLCTMAALSVVILVWYAAVSRKNLRSLPNRKKR